MLSESTPASREETKEKRGIGIANMYGPGAMVQRSALRAEDCLAKANIKEGKLVTTKKHLCLLWCGLLGGGLLCGRGGLLLGCGLCGLLRLGGCLSLGDAARLGLSEHARDLLVDSRGISIPRLGGIGLGLRGGGRLLCRGGLGRRRLLGCGCLLGRRGLGGRLLRGAGLLGGSGLLLLGLSSLLRGRLLLRQLHCSGSSY